MMNSVVSDRGGGGTDFAKQEGISQDKETSFSVRECVCVCVCECVCVPIPIKKDIQGTGKMWEKGTKAIKHIQ